MAKRVNITNNSIEQRLSRLIKMGADALLQAFDAKLAAVTRLYLDDAVGVEQQAIARRKFRFGSLKLRVRNDPYRRSGGIRAHDDGLHFAGTSTDLQWRWVTRARETGDACFDVDDAVQHRHKNKRAGLFQNSRELAVQLREKATGLGCFDRMSFDHCAHHRGDQRCADAMAHYIANTNGGRIFVKPCDMKEIAAH